MKLPDGHRLLDPWEIRKRHRLDPVRCYLTLRRFLEPYWYRMRWSADPWSGHLDGGALPSVEGSEHEVELLLSLEKIPSAVTAEQARALYHFARCAPADGEVVEIGSGMGKSTLALAWGSKRNRFPCVVHTVDPLPDMPDMPRHERFEVLTRTFQEYGGDNIVLHVRSSGEYRRESTAAIRLLFVDAAHDYLNSCFDLAAYKTLVVPGGFVIAHDVDNPWYGPGTRKAFIDCILYDRAFRLWHHMQNLAVAKKSNRQTERLEMSPP